MPQELEYVNALYFVIRAVETTLNTDGMTPFAVQAIGKFKAAYRAVNDPHDGDPDLVGLATMASFVEFKHIVPSMTPIDIAGADNIRARAVNLATEAGFSAASFSTDISLDTSLGDLMIDFVQASPLPNGPVAAAGTQDPGDGS